MKVIRRRLVQQGSSTLMVSLPAPWIKNRNLKKGSEVSIEPLNNDLLLSASAEIIKQETSIVLQGKKESDIRTMITNTYRLGYERIKVSFADENQYKILNNIVKTRLIGFEVISKEKDYCIVENVTEPATDQFDNIMHKIFFSIEEIFEITKKRLDNYSEDSGFEDVEERIQKYDNFCRRVITKQKIYNEKSEFLWAFLSFILHGQRELYHLNKALAKDFRASTQTKQLLASSKQVFELVRTGFFDKDITVLTKIHDIEKETIYKTGYELLAQKKNFEAVAIYHILNSIREFYQANSPLSGIIL